MALFNPTNFQNQLGTFDAKIVYDNLMSNLLTTATPLYNEIKTVPVQRVGGKQFNFAVMLSTTGSAGSVGLQTGYQYNGQSFPPSPLQPTGAQGTALYKNIFSTSNITQDVLDRAGIGGEGYFENPEMVADQIRVNQLGQVQEIQMLLKPCERDTNIADPGVPNGATGVRGQSTQATNGAGNVNTTLVMTGWTDPGCFQRDIILVFGTWAQLTGAALSGPGARVRVIDLSVDSDGVVTLTLNTVPNDATGNYPAFSINIGDVCVSGSNAQGAAPIVGERPWNEANNALTSIPMMGTGGTTNNTLFGIDPSVSLQGAWQGTQSSKTVRTTLSADRISNYIAKYALLNNKVSPQYAVMNPLGWTPVQNAMNAVAIQQELVKVGGVDVEALRWATVNGKMTFISSPRAPLFEFEFINAEKGKIAKAVLKEPGPLTTPDGLKWYSSPVTSTTWERADYAMYELICKERPGVGRMTQVQMDASEYGWPN